MRKFLFTIQALFCLSFLHAQVVLYGLTSGGGSGNGTIIKYETATNTLQAVYAFTTTDGKSPHGSLIIAGDNKLYGMTSAGGTYGYGTIFSFDPFSGVFAKLHDFDGTNGAEPNGSLVQSANGKLYGMTTFGGVNNRGTIFSYDPVSGVFAKLHDFELYNGKFPYGSLTPDVDGKLYGLTSEGGQYCDRSAYCGGDGISFSFDPSDNTFTKVDQLYGFSYPFGSYTLASNGVFYATNSAAGGSACGGKSGDGAISGFSTRSAYTAFTPFYNYSSYIVADPNGRMPYGDLLQASDGNLYGTASAGGSASRCGGPSGFGTIFMYDTATKQITNKTDFTGANGSRPYGSLMQASDGNIYGMTSSGGSNNLGVLFSYNLTNSAYTKLQDFTGANGASPWYGKLIEVKSCTVPMAAADSVARVCAGSTLTLHAWGGKTYSWSGPGGFSTTWQSPVIDNVTAANAGEYTVTVSNGEGCTAKATTKVMVNPSPQVAIPDTSALKFGVDKNTVYIGFSPASYITLKASVAPNSDSLTYSWSTGNTTSTVRVNPTTTTTYSVTVSDAFGCSQTANKTVYVQDIRCGNKSNKVLVCSNVARKSGKFQENCVDPFSAAIELLLGAHLGSCNANNSQRELSDKIEEDKKDQLSMKISPNPTTNYFRININSNNTKNEIYVRVLDNVGRLLEVMSIKNSQTLTVGASYNPGVYFVEAVQGRERVTLKVIKQ